MKDEIPILPKDRIKQFALAYALYTAVHSCRSTWSYVAGLLVEGEVIADFDSKFLGYVNFTFLLSLGVAYFLYNYV